MGSYSRRGSSTPRPRAVFLLVLPDHRFLTEQPEALNRGEKPLTQDELIVEVKERGWPLRRVCRHVVEVESNPLADLESQGAGTVC